MAKQYFTRIRDMFAVPANYEHQINGCDLSDRLFIDRLMSSDLNIITAEMKCIENRLR